MLLTDALGSLVATTDAAGGVQSELTYEPFGNTEMSSPSPAYRFTGREHDEPLYLYYYRARYYHTDLQRFISEDPIGFRGGDVNLYSYVLDNPTNSIDPLGYGALDSAINYVLTKVMTNPKVPLFIFIPATFYDVVAMGPCIIPKRLVQAGGAYVGSWAGSIAGADLGFVVGEAIVPFGGGFPGAFVGWAAGGAAGSAAGALGAGLLYDAVVPGGDCRVPPASGKQSKSAS